MEAEEDVRRGEEAQGGGRGAMEKGYTGSSPPGEGQGPSREGAVCTPQRNGLPRSAAPGGPMPPWLSVFRLVFVSVDFRTCRISSIPRMGRKLQMYRAADLYR
ncbi:hypothetical protein WMY93_024310 [Mugilogobius chulae]|uniref:Uncharacterized protein n=1 Tax=Mugilogobius chulae TaxID=88201 RepID=A0AAW0N443_9GOBI